MIAYRRKMKNRPVADPAKRKQALGSRVFWFLAGSGVNYALIAFPFKYLKAHTDLSTFGVAACSIGLSTSFFFVWNYFINFRSETRKRDAFPRYCAAVGVMALLSANVLTLLKNHDAHMAFRLGSFPLDLDVVATQFFLAGLKFFLYHKWVFPLAPREEPLPDPELLTQSRKDAKV